ncbi:TetR/AcrR family transcriptional regulator [Caballeronia sp. 15711]|uniref:TetR/AcrR family transcriptional regulator n=1 Tax=Caballeronia sp. 15711 TaxID=3391029 RepID=UPI0039E3E743
MVVIRQRKPRGGGDQLRTEIVDVATRLLSTLGDSEPFLLRAVAKEANISRPSVYLHFADKTALMLAVLIQLFDEPAVSRDRAEAEAAAAESQEELNEKRLASSIDWAGC